MHSPSVFVPTIGRRLSVAVAALAIALAPHGAARAQAAALTVDTLRTSCGILDPSARQCAVDRLAHRVKARLGLSDDLTWDASRSAFVAGDLSVPARVRYVESGKVLTAVAMFEAPAAEHLPTGLQVATTKRIESSAHARQAPVEAEIGLRESGQRVTTVRPTEEAIAAASVDLSSSAPLLDIRSVRALVTVTASGRSVSEDGIRSVSRALARYVPPSMRAPALPPPPPPRLIARGPGPTVPVIIGREKPVALHFVLADSVTLWPGVDDEGAETRTAIRPVRITKGTCGTGWFSPLDIADTRVETDGTLTCYVRFGESVTADRATKMSVSLEAGHRRLTQTLTVKPVLAPTYAVRGGNGCEAVVQRVHKMLVDRGVPVVSYSGAHRRADLSNCERFDRILPVAVGALNPAGIYLTGEITEAGVSVYSDARSVGPIELWTTKPSGDPTNELAEAIVARLLKYTGL